MFTMGKDAEQDRGENAVAVPLGGQFEKTQWGETVKAHRILQEAAAQCRESRECWVHVGWVPIPVLA